MLPSWVLLVAFVGGAGNGRTHALPAFEEREAEERVGAARAIRIWHVINSHLGKDERVCRLCSSRDVQHTPTPAGQAQWLSNLPTPRCSPLVFRSSRALMAAGLLAAGLLLTPRRRRSAAKSIAGPSGRVEPM